MPSEIPDGSAPPPWDQDEGDGLVGQMLLAGFTYLAADGKTVTSQVQFWGRIVSATPKGVAVVCEGKVWSGQTVNLPPHLSMFLAARPGEYRLRSTGETVKDPDLTTSWTITQSPKS
jgi:hypothetical protein